jgi:UV DNA damage endonuclease
MLRLGLCCGFVDEDIHFRTTTARYVLSRPPAERGPFLGQLALDNAQALVRAIDWCAAHGVGAFRVNSGFLPLFTHPEAGYRFEALPTAAAVDAVLAEARERARRADVRLSFHPDQFVVPGSLSEATVRQSLAELEYQAELAERIGAVQLTLHGGGAQGGKEEALERLLRGIDLLTPRARALIVLENDDRVYTVMDLLSVCARAGLPLVYDVHHHRCNPDELSEAEATELAARTWGEREPWVHLSSPREGWRSSKPQSHADFIAARDLPAAWPVVSIDRRLTVDVEAKAKEQAVLRLQRLLRRRSAAHSAEGSERKWPAAMSKIHKR